MKEQGFTLVEVLIVLGVLAILLAIGIPSYLSWIASLQAQNAAVVLAQEIQRARSEVKRTAVGTSGAQPTLTLATTSGSSTFTSGTRTITLEGASIQTTQALTFRSPYGTVDLASSSLPVSFTVRSNRNTTKTRTVRVISVMGKVVIR